MLTSAKNVKQPNYATAVRKIEEPIPPGTKPPSHDRQPVSEPLSEELMEGGNEVARLKCCSAF